MSVKLLIADDHEVVRCGLRSLIANTEIEIIGEAATGEQAIALAMEMEPDVVLCGHWTAACFEVPLPCPTVIDLAGSLIGRSVAGSPKRGSSVRDTHGLLAVP